MNTYEQHSTRKLITTLLSIVVIAGSVLIADHIKSESTSALQPSGGGAPARVVVAAPATPATPAAASTPTSAAPSATPPPASSGYTDGSFKVTNDYYVPSGDETIQVNLTLKNGVISNASVTNSEGNGVSAHYQEDFASAYKSYVVGKKISSLQLGVIAGASYTSQSFSDAVSQIAAKAKA